MVTLQEVSLSEKKLLYNLLQKYLYEMSQYYEDDIDTDGEFPYEYFEYYFVDKTRKAFLILYDGNIAGFVLLNKYSCINENPDRTIAEFCILPKYRKNHIAKTAVEILFQKYKGLWEIKYHSDNLAAKKLWQSVSKQFNPQHYVLPDKEEVLSFVVSEEVESMHLS